MKNTIKTLVIVAMLATITVAGSFGTAYWTGNKEQVQTVSHRMAWNCEYSYNGQKFWKVFENSCPSSVQVR